MSGPKIDFADIERIQRERLQRERLQKIALIKKATENYFNELDKIENIIHNIRYDNKELIDKYLTEKETRYVIDTILSLKRYYTGLLRGLKSDKLPEDPESINEATAELIKKIEIICNNYKQETECYFKRIMDYDLKAEQIKSLKSFSVEIRNKSGGYNIENIVFNYKQTSENEKLFDTAREITDEILIYLNCEFILEKDREVLYNYLYGIINALKDDSISNLKTKISEYSVIRKEIENKIVNLKEAYNEYASEFVSFGKNKSQILNPYQFGSIEELEEETERIKRLARYEMEQNFIKEQLDEVMKSFGYGLCESIVLDECHKGKHYLCNHENSDNAIHVYISESNTIMLETVESIDEETETPSVINAEIIASDKLDDNALDKALERQGQFCKMHPEIVKELEKRGVILSEKNHKAPDKRHAKKVKKFVSEKTIKKKDNTSGTATIKKLKEGVINE